MHILHRDSSGQQEITIYETAQLYGERGYFRVMQFSEDAIQGAIDISQPKRVLFEYPRAIIHLMEHNLPGFEDVFVIGHGIGTIAGQYPDKRFRVAELDSRVLELSRKYFAYTQDNVMIGDGRELLENEAPHSLDCIILDAFNPKGTPRHLTNPGFFAITAGKLDPQGVLILNLMGRGENDRNIKTIHASLSQQFSFTRSFILPAAGKHNNVILAASGKPLLFQSRHMAGFEEMT
jgi:spermidine synthase